ncbi:MAG TPA: aminotransferase class V-fold PLP-dependent enzyme, partial [Thermoleophilia bacterium]|nr:aminotransferase class V-fold PLP-dependent enzyme [Thermoleophilia bacterium]
MKPVYFDHAATTPVDPRVFEAMTPFFCERFGNPSEPHRLGREARSAVDEARARVAALLGAGENEIVFTAGGTEADNLALFGSLARLQPGHLVVSAVEHPAVMEAARALNGRGWDVDYVPVDGHGVVDRAAYRAAFRDDTRLVSVMTANNVVGTVQPVA